MPTKNTPARMYIVDLSRPDQPDNTIDAQFNPTELEETLSVNWGKLAVLGLSHMPLQYQQTDNHGFSFELAFHAVVDQSAQLFTIARARRFLLALGYPTRRSQSVATGAPPRALFFWPQLASITCVLRKVTFKHTLFNQQGDPIMFTAKVTLEEIRDARLYADEVLESGTIRSTGS
jgi:contractile injection system tube protein